MKKVLSMVKLVLGTIGTKHSFFTITKLACSSSTFFEQEANHAGLNVLRVQESQTQGWVVPSSISEVMRGLKGGKRQAIICYFSFELLKVLNLNCLVIFVHGLSDSVLYEIGGKTAC